MGLGVQWAVLLSMLTTHGFAGTDLQICVAPYQAIYRHF